MTPRMTENKSAARYRLLSGELMQYSFLPVSNYVHLVRVIVKTTGEIEVGDWIFGATAKNFSHRIVQASADSYSRLQDVLETLAGVARKLQIEFTEEDFEEFEGRERKMIRYWEKEAETELCLLRDEYYRKYDISHAEQNEYETAFEAVVSILPIL